MHVYDEEEFTHLESIAGFSWWGVNSEEGVWVAALSPPPPLPLKYEAF